SSAESGKTTINGNVLARYICVLAASEPCDQRRHFIRLTVAFDWEQRRWRAVCFELRFAFHKIWRNAVYKDTGRNAFMIHARTEYIEGGCGGRSYAMPSNDTQR